jgi:hypothetical protein
LLQLQLFKNLVLLSFFFPFLSFYLLQAKEQAAAEKQLTTHVPSEVNAGNAKQLNAAPIFNNKEKKKQHE